MCEHHEHSRPRHGAALEHGAAHKRDHANWSRRDFLSGLGLVAGGAIMMGGMPVRAFGASPLLAQLSAADNDRILVLIQLSGGNDGLNTVVPYENDLYYNVRPNIRIDKAIAQARAVGNDMGLHPDLDPIYTMFQDGKMGLLQNVGYPSPNLSHFRSTDIWLSATDSDAYDTTGWAGRHLDYQYPGYSDNPPDKPIAVQLGGTSPLLFQGPEAQMSMSISSIQFLDRIIETGQLYTTDGLPATTYGNEMEFVRTVANDAFQYAEAVQDASEAGMNNVEYPVGNPLANSLMNVARFIKGGLDSKIYHVSLGGFDTHANQANNHARLMGWLAGAVDAFTRDLESDGFGDRVLTMTFSEFGRRVEQNGSFGTDHGTAAPLFLFGSGVTGGLYGHAPVLNDLDNNGNLKHDIDFRSVYGTIMQDWFGIEQQAVQDTLLGFPYTPLNFIADPAQPVSTDTPSLPVATVLNQNYPNPVRGRTTITYQLGEATPVRLEVFDIQGRRIRVLENSAKPAGIHQTPFYADRLPAGTYFYRLTTASGVENRQMIVL